MVGQKPAVPAKEIIEALINFDIYQSNKKLKRKKDPIWQEICDILNNNRERKIKPLNLYMHVDQDRHNIQSSYRKIKDLDIHDSDDCETTIEENNEDEISESENTKEDTDCYRPTRRKNSKNIVFNFTITPEQWSQIKPVKKIYKDGREGMSLQDPYRRMVVQEMYYKEKLPCTYSIERNVIDDIESYVKIIGYCKTCNADLKINCFDKPIDGEPVTFIVETFNSHGIPHTTKRRLAGSERKTIKEELKHKKPKQWRREQASKHMKFGDPEPSFLYNQKVIQKASHEVKYENLGLKPGVKLFESLESLKKNVEFNRYFRGIGLDKFYLMYWSPEQVSIHNDVQAKLRNPLSLDATGSVALKIKRIDGESSDIFLTVLSTYINNMIVPVAQVMSEKNDTNFLSYWLLEWRKSGAKIPDFVVTDMGKGIQNSVCLSFNTMNFAKYNDECLKFLLNPETKIELNTQLSTDVAHLVHAVTKWPCFSKDKPKVKELFKRCAGFMTNINDFKNFSEFLVAVFIVSNSKNNNDRCQKALTYIIERIQTYKFDGNVTEKLEVLEKKELVEIFVDIEDLNTKSNQRLTRKYVDELKAKSIDSKSEHNNSSDFNIQNNDYYLPDFADRLSVLCTEFPCWTKVMNAYFDNSKDVATSARAESYFSDFKSSNEASQREDVVFINHCRQINSDMILARAALNNLQPDDIVSKKKLAKDDNEFLFASERWKHQYTKEEFEEFSDFLSETVELAEKSIAETICEKNGLVSNDENKPKQEEKPYTEILMQSNDASFEDGLEGFSDNIELTSSAIIDEKSPKTISSTLKQQSINNNESSNLHFYSDHTYYSLEQERESHQQNFQCQDKDKTLDFQHLEHALSSPENYNHNHEVNYPDVKCSINTIQNSIPSTVKDEQVSQDKKTFSNNAKTRGKYVSAEPGLNLVLQKGKRKNRGRKIIQNGNKLQEKSVRGVKYRFTNTCSFDTITEIVTHSCYEIQTFEEFMNNNINKILEMQNLCYASTIINYARSSISNTLYTNRAYILHSLQPKVSSFDIDCQGNIGNLFCSLMREYASIRETSLCQTCGDKTVHSKCLIPIPNTNIITKYNFTTMQEGLDEYFREKYVFCQNCKTSSALLSSTVGSYLSIDTEDSYKRSVNPTNFNQLDITSNLDQVPVSINVKKDTFALCGVARYVPPVVDNGMGHYIAYCRKVNGTWDERNDLLSYKKAITEAQTKRLQMKISMLFYVKFNDNS